jgi:protein SCO1/2
MKNIKWLYPAIGFILIFIAGVWIAYPILKKTPVLRIYNPVDINPRLVDDSLKRVTKNHRVADFKLVNQFGDTITNADFKGKIYVADFFFTTCPTICKDMSRNFAKLDAEFANQSDIMLLSHSVTPEIDSVEVLAEYAERYGATPGKWHLTTGDKKHIYALARKSYFACMDEGDGGVQDFIHTENFVLVDKEGRLRGFYDGTADVEVERLIREIGYLQKEYEKQQ